MTIPSPSPKSIKVGVLGATGPVGQRFITLLSTHPWFTIHALGASERNAGRCYRDAVKGRWVQRDGLESLDGKIGGIVVVSCSLDDSETGDRWRECVLVFSALDADVAGDIEASFRKADIPLFSNAKSYRRDPQVPLVVPLVNPSHLSIIPQQRRLLGLRKGFIVTNANCSTTALVVPLAALEKNFGPLESVSVVTMQAVSGAGYPGVASLDIMDNVVPYIGGEEEKMEWETLKILSSITESESEEGLKEFDMRAQDPILVTASCNRVPVLNGHTLCVSVRFKKRPPPTPTQVREALAAYAVPGKESRSCPTSPSHPIIVYPPPPLPTGAVTPNSSTSSVASSTVTIPTPAVPLHPPPESTSSLYENRPQPRLDHHLQNGSCVVVGRVRECQVGDIKFVVVADNVSIGAATSSIINAELALMMGLVQ